MACFLGVRYRLSAAIDIGSLRRCLKNPRETEFLDFLLRAQPAVALMGSPIDGLPPIPKQGSAFASRKELCSLAALGLGVFFRFPS